MGQPAGTSEPSPATTPWQALEKTFAKSIAVRGVFGTVVFCATSIARAARRLDVGRQRVERGRRHANAEFDRRHGIDTAGVIPLSNLAISDRSWIHGVRYEAVAPDVDFAAVLADRAIPYAQFTFVDLGSGKGRAVLLASSLPFRKVIGVELSPQLHSIARRNIEIWRNANPGRSEIELTCADAASYRLPTGPLVVFMYNPLHAQIMRRVVDALVADYQREPRRIVVVYFTPKHAALWDAVPFLRRVAEQPGYHIYDTIRD